MKVTINDVEKIIDAEVKGGDSMTSAYVYVPKALKGRKVKIIVMTEDLGLDSSHSILRELALSKSIGKITKV